jgi:ABC-type dipeptide/oligopeptide/nickel transport system ATPase component
MSHTIVRRVFKTPMTALDITIEAQILELLRSLRKERGMSIMLITHDIAVTAEMANRTTTIAWG